MEALSTSEKIQMLMIRHKVTQNDLASLLGVTGETIHNRIAADRWDIKDLRKIAETYHINSKDLI